MHEWSFFAQTHACGHGEDRTETFHKQHFEVQEVWYDET